MFWRKNWKHGFWIRELFYEKQLPEKSFRSFYQKIYRPWFFFSVTFLFKFCKDELTPIPFIETFIALIPISCLSNQGLIERLAIIYKEIGPLLVKLEELTIIKREINNSEKTGNSFRYFGQCKLMHFMPHQM